MFKIISFILALIVTSGCSYQNYVIGDINKIPRNGKYALIEFIISPHVRPTTPIIDAAFYQTYLDNIVFDIIEYNLKNVNIYERYAGKKFEESKFDILYSDSLISNKNYQSLKGEVNVFSLDFHDLDFPQIIIPSKSYNFFNFDQTSSSLNYFDKFLEESDLENISKICKAMKLDGVFIINLTILPSSEMGIFFSSWWRVLNTKIYFFDSKGTKTLTISYYSDYLKGYADDYNNYVYTLKQFYSNIDDILKYSFNKTK